MNFNLNAARIPQGFRFNAPWRGIVSFVARATAKKTARVDALSDYMRADIGFGPNVPGDGPCPRADSVSIRLADWRGCPI